MTVAPVISRFRRLSNAPAALLALLALSLVTLCLVAGARAIEAPMPVLIGMLPGVLLVRCGRPLWGITLVMAGMAVDAGLVHLPSWTALWLLGLMLLLSIAPRDRSYCALLGHALMYCLAIGGIRLGYDLSTDCDSRALLRHAGEACSLTLQSLLGLAGAACCAAVKPLWAVRHRIINYQRVATFDFQFCSAFLVALGLAVLTSGPSIAFVFPAEVAVGDAPALPSVGAVLRPPAWALGLAALAYLLVGLNMLAANARVRQPLLRTLQNLAQLLRTEPLSPPASLRPLWSPLAIVRHLDRACRHLNHLLQREKALGALLIPHVLGEAAVVLKIHFYAGGQHFHVDADELRLAMVVGWPVVEADNWNWWLTRVHPEERAYGPEAILRRLRSEGRLFQTFRFKEPDGQWRRLHLALLLVERSDAKGTFMVAGVMRRDGAAAGSGAQTSGVPALAQAQVALFKALLHEAYQPLNTIQLAAENGHQQCNTPAPQDSQALSAQFALVLASVERLSASLRRSRVALETTTRRPHGTLLGPIIQREVEAFTEQASNDDLCYLLNLDPAAAVTGRAPEVYQCLIEAVIEGFTAWVDKVSPPGLGDGRVASITLKSEPDSQAVEVLFKFLLPDNSSAETYAEAMESLAGAGAKLFIFAEQLTTALGGVLVRQVHNGALRITLTLAKHMGPAA